MPTKKSAKAAPAAPARPVKTNRNGTIRSATVLVRMNDEEKLTMERAARQQGLPLATWMRYALLASARMLNGEAPVTNARSYGAGARRAG